MNKNSFQTTLTEAEAGRRTASESGQPSVWLYAAGLLITLSGLFAVCYDLESSSYRLMMYALTIVGYVFSFVLRRKRWSLHVVQAPLLLAIGLFIAVAASANHGVESLLPVEAVGDRAKVWQMIIAWVAVFHAFALNSDAGVLFCCVPSMTMIALVSTYSPDNETTGAFLVFVGAATFLMVHENYLRTRQRTRRDGRSGRMVGDQLQLAALCVFSSLLLARVAVIPIRIIGRALFIPTNLSALTGTSSRTPRKTPAPVESEMQESVELANGPVNAGEQVLLTVAADSPYYWRGATFDSYTGNQFTNTVHNSQIVTPDEERNWWGFGSPFASQHSGWKHGTEREEHKFVLPPNDLELSAAEMHGSHECQQTIVVYGNTFSQIYGAGRIEQVRLTAAALTYGYSGTLAASFILPEQTTYTVTSRIADSNPEHLRAASSDLKEVPASIREYYTSYNREDGRLARLVQRLTQHCTNNYDRVLAIQHYLSQHCKYNLQTPRAPREEDGVSYFLFESRMGYCDIFGAALTLLCRYAGIPSRLASGFITGDYKDGKYTVCDKHRHIWTEVFFSHIGWVTFDATAGAEDVSDYSNPQTAPMPYFLRWMFSNGSVPPTAALLCVVLIGVVLFQEAKSRLRRRTADDPAQRAIINGEVEAAYAAACIALKRRGLGRLPTLTPDEYLQWLQTQAADTLPEAMVPLQTLTELYSRFRYGKETATEAELVQAKEALNSIRQHLRGYQPPSQGKRKLLQSGIQGK